MAQAITAPQLIVTPRATHAAEPPPLPRRRTPSGTIPAGTPIGNWRLERELGRGGMASVYSAAHGKFGKQAALKIAHPSILGEDYTAETFLREARVIQQVEHPGVPAILDAGTHDGRPFFAMERLTGQTLGQRIDRGPIPRGEVIDILLELCEILRVAHAAGIVHRDLKLDNVFLSDSPYAGGMRVKLIDWGVAYVAGEDDPFRGMIAGTLTYVAPEQIRGEPLTGACDVYSLAVMAYTLLSGRAPFAAKSELELVHMHLRAEPPRLATAWQGAPDEIDDLIHRMLAKQAADRPSLGEVVKVLKVMRNKIAPIRAQYLIALPDVKDVSDVLGRPAIWVPPFRAGWISLAATLAGIAALLAALPG